MHTHVHLCARCGAAWDHSCAEDCERPGRWGFCSDPCRFTAEGESFLKSTLRDQQRIEAERYTLALRSRSQRNIDRGKRNIAESPLFGGPAQQELF